MKSTIENKKIIDVSKTILAEKTNGDAIGIYKFSGESLKVLIDELDNLVSNSITKKLFTYAVRNILNRTDVYSVSTKGLAWIEIDDQNDLNMAQNLIKKIEKD
jgi:choline kinase